MKNKDAVIEILAKITATVMVCAVMMTVCLAIAKLVGIADISFLTIITPLAVTGGVFIAICILIFTVTLFRGIWSGTGKDKPNSDN